MILPSMQRMPNHRRPGPAQERPQIPNMNIVVPNRLDTLECLGCQECTTVYRSPPATCSDLTREVNIRLVLDGLRLSPELVAASKREELLEKLRQIAQHKARRAS